MSILSLAREQRDQQSLLVTQLILEIGRLWLPFLGRRKAAGREDVPDLVQVLAPLVQQYGQASGALARDFYSRQRAEAGITSPFATPVVAPASNDHIGRTVLWAVNPRRSPPAMARPDAVARSPFGRGDQNPSPGPAAPSRAQATPSRAPARPSSSASSAASPPSPAQTARSSRQPAPERTREPEPDDSDTSSDPDSDLIDLDRLGQRQLDDLTGSLGRLAQQTGRNTLEEAIEKDPNGVAWARIPGGPDPCSFCLMTISRGAVYINRKAALFKGGTRDPYHDRCRCTCIPIFKDNPDPLPGDTIDAINLWYDTAAYFSGKDAINAFARAVGAIRAGKDPETAVFRGYEGTYGRNTKMIEKRRQKALDAALGSAVNTGDGSSDPRFGG